MERDSTHLRSGDYGWPLTFTATREQLELPLKSHQAWSLQVLIADLGEPASQDVSFVERDRGSDVVFESVFRGNEVVGWLVHYGRNRHAWYKGFRIQDRNCLFLLRILCASLAATTCEVVAITSTCPNKKLLPTRQVHIVYLPTEPGTEAASMYINKVSQFCLPST